MRLAVLTLAVGAILGAAAAPGTKPASLPTSEFAKALDAAIDGKAQIETVHVLAQSGADGVSASVHGSGVGTVGTTQVRVTPAVIKGLLVKVRASGFATMPGTFGSMPPAVAPNVRPRYTASVVGAVTVTIGRTAKTVSQLGEGEQSAALRQLIRDLDADLQPLVKDGLDLKALSLKGAMARLADGTLAPEAVTVRFVWSARTGLGEAHTSSFVLSEGRLAVDGAVVDLPHKGLEALGKRLGKVLADVESLPPRLHHVLGPVTLNVIVWGVPKQANTAADNLTDDQARGAEHPQEQLAFEAIVAELCTIHTEFSKQAKAAPGN